MRRALCKRSALFHHRQDAPQHLRPASGGALLAVPVGTLTPKEGGTPPFFFLILPSFPGSVPSQRLPRSAEQPGGQRAGAMNISA